MPGACQALRHLLYLQYMALGTIFRAFSGAGAVLNMALNTLLVKGIGFFRILSVFYIGSVVAFQARFRHHAFLGFGLMALSASDQGRFVIGWVMMAIETIKSISVCGRVGLVIKEDFAGIG